MRSSAWRVAPVGGLLAVLAAAQDGPRPIFAEIGERALPGVRVTCGALRKDYIVEVNGGGLALADLDRDGDLDLVVVDGSTVERVRAGEPGLPPRVFLGRGDGTFAPAGEGWELGGGRWGMGAATGDVDGDGWIDLAITQWGPTRLFRNREGRGLEEITDRAGLDAGGWGTSATFLDFDGDGSLDLFVAQYLDFDPERVARRGSGTCRWKGHDVLCGPEGLTPLPDRLYRGRGDGTFADVSEASGLRAVAPAFGLGVTTLDVDLDGDTDLYVANDSTPNHLWRNEGDGTFVEVAYRLGIGHDANGKEQAGMGIACADWNRDGRDDLFVTNFSGENDVLYASVASGAFRERSARAGLAGPSLPLLGWGTGFHDLDLDGDLDLFAVHGHVYPQADEPGTDTSYAQVDHLLRNDGQGRFGVEPLSSAGAGVGRAAVAGDLDRDGDVDLVILPLEGAVRVLRNDAPRGADRHWIAVALRSRSKNTAGLGARVRVEWEGGARSATVRGSAGYQAAQPAEVHFGLGAVARVQRIVVRWPSGREQKLESPAVDRLHSVAEE